MTYNPTLPYKNVDGVNINLTEDEISALAAQRAAFVTENSTFQLKTQALAALKESDITMLRCVEKGVSIPSEWATYRAALRSVVDGSSSTIPTQPAYPAGT